MLRIYTGLVVAFAVLSSAHGQDAARAHGGPTSTALKRAEQDYDVKKIGLALLSTRSEDHVRFLKGVIVDPKSEVSKRRDAMTSLLQVLVRAQEWTREYEKVKSTKSQPGGPRHLRTHFGP